MMWYNQYHTTSVPTMTKEEFLKEMEEQSKEERRIGYRDHHLYDDAMYDPVDIDYTTQS